MCFEIEPFFTGLFNQISEQSPHFDNILKHTNSLKQIHLIKEEFKEELTVFYFYFFPESNQSLVVGTGTQQVLLQIKFLYQKIKYCF